MIRCILCAVCVYLLIAGLVQTAAMVAFVLVPGIFLHTAGQRLAMPQVDDALWWGVALTVLGGFTLWQRDRIFAPAAQAAAGAPRIRRWGPRLLQVLGFLLVLRTAWVLPWLIRDARWVGDELTLRIALANDLLNGDLPALVAGLAGAALLLRARELHARLHPDTATRRRS